VRSAAAERSHARAAAAFIALLAAAEGEYNHQTKKHDSQNQDGFFHNFPSSTKKLKKNMTGKKVQDS